jgi:hypothetical protein
MRLRQWCQDAATTLEDLRHWGTIAQVTDTVQSSRLAHLQRRLITDRTHLAFLAESGRGSGQLINSLLFSDFGVPVIPENTDRSDSQGNAAVLGCPLELTYDPSKPPSIRLLPMESRADPRSLREYLASDDGWAMQTLELSSKTKIASGIAETCHTVEIPLADAVKYSLPPRLFGQTVGEDGSPKLIVPRWRYAKANLPHPALRCGLVITHAPSITCLQIEPELTEFRLRDADGIVFVADIVRGIEAADIELWRNFFGGEQDYERAFLVLNGVEKLERSHMSADAERCAILASSSLGISRARIYAVANGNDAQANQHSEMDRFASSIADAVFAARGKAHAAAMQAECGTMLSESRHVLDSRRDMMEEHLSELNALFTKNERLMMTLSQRVTDEGTRVRSAQALFDDCSASHHENMEGIRTRLDHKSSKLRSAGVANRISSGTAGKDVDNIIAQYFHENAKILDGAVSRIQTVQSMVQQLNRAFSLDYGLKPVDVPHFATVRFAGELSKLEAKAVEEFKGAKRSLTRSWDAIAEDFTDEIGSKVDHIYMVASRESNLWLNSLMRGFEAELAQMQHDFSQRIGSMSRLKAADNKLDTEIAELTAQRNDIVKYRDELANKARHVAGLLEQFG